MLKYKDFSLIKPTETQCQRISEIIKNEDGSIFHEVEINKIVQENFNTDFYFLVDDPVNIKNFSPIHITKSKLGIKRFYFKPLYDIPYAGFIRDEEVDFSNFSLGLFESLDFSGFPRRKNLKNNVEIDLFGETSMVDLSLDEDDIFNNTIHSKRRNMIRKAEKSEIRIKKFLSIEGLEIFWPMLEELHKKLGYTNLNYEYYKKIFNNYALKKQAFILVAFKNTLPISGIFILGNRNFMHYYKGASVFNVKNEGQGELLQWEAIKISKSLGSKYYDLCNIESEKLPAIYRFKTGISKEIYQYPKYTRSALGYKIINKLSKLI